jgi:hypothetical protein
MTDTRSACQGTHPSFLSPACRLCFLLAVVLVICLPGSQAHCQIETYDKDTPINAFFITPEQNEAFANATYDLAVIGLGIRVVDYDKVTATSADGTKSFTNKEREVYSEPDGHPNFLITWTLVAGAGALVPTGPQPSLYATFAPAGDFIEGNVTVRCTIQDNSNNPERRDPDVVLERTFSIVNRPTAHVSVTAIDEGGPPAPGPIASGFKAEEKVKLQFSVYARKGSWHLLDTDVTWTTPWGSGSGEIYTTPNPIPVDEDHRRFQYSVIVIFSLPGYPPFIPPQYSLDSRSGSQVLAFEKSGHDELNDTSRGRSSHVVNNQRVDIIADPPNWFDNRVKHWGRVVPKINDTDNKLAAPDFIVYYAPRFADQPPMAVAYTDYFADHAPIGHLGEREYRGRIYVFEQNGTTGDQDPSRSLYGLRAAGIDRVAVTVQHEFMHRELWTRPFNWGGWDDDQIKDPVSGAWIPGNPAFQNHDKDGDYVRNTYESLNRDSHFHEDNKYSILRWWTGNPAATGNEQNRLDDDEMYAQLWGEWDAARYLIGSLDGSDWSSGGRQDW